VKFTPVDELPSKGHGGGSSPSPETIELANYLAAFHGQWVKLDEPYSVNYGASLKNGLNKVVPATYEVRYRKSDQKSDTSKYSKQWIYIRRAPEEY
jgi:hypothetical protein